MRITNYLDKINKFENEFTTLKITSHHIKYQIKKLKELNLRIKILKKKLTLDAENHSSNYYRLNKLRQEMRVYSLIRNHSALSKTALTAQGLKPRFIVNRCLSLEAANK